MQIAERFGAKVSIGLPGRGMFLLEVAEPGGLDALVRSVGGQVVARFEASEKVLAAVAYRGALPLSVSERLVTLVSEQIRDHLIAHQQV